MNFAHKKQSLSQKYIGIGLVVLFHIILIYALINGLARKVVEIVKGPIETKIIEEVIKLPPKPLPPPPPQVKTVVPPPFVPPPEVHVAPAVSTNAISTQSKTPVVENVHTRLPPVIDAKHSCKLPVYPAASRRNEEEGTVVLSFLISPAGKVVQSKVEQSSGFDRLDDAAREALSLCQFKAGSVDGVPEQSWAKIKYVWRLQ